MRFHSNNETPNGNSSNDISSVRKYTLIAVLASAAAALQIIESPLPRLVPWLKPGLANVMTLYAIIRLSPFSGFAVAIVRTFIAGIFLGTFLSPVYLISLSGALSSTLAMSILKKVFPLSGLGPVSIIGALASNWAQLTAVEFLFSGNMSLWLHLAVMIWVAIPSGLIVAGITGELLRRT
ncbi:MAG: Gx transporter family protein [Candidatus Rifleibacteriota bacterium]